MQAANFGLKLRLFWPPTPANTTAFLKCSTPLNAVTDLLGKLDEGYYFATRTGNAIYISEGWLHATYALESSIVVGSTWSTTEGLELAARFTACKVGQTQAYIQEVVVLAQCLLMALGIWDGKGAMPEPATTKNTKRTSSRSAASKAKRRKTNRAANTQQEKLEGEGPPQRKEEVRQALQLICPRVISSQQGISKLGQLNRLTGDPTTLKTVESLFQLIRERLEGDRYHENCKHRGKDLLTHVP